jgi:leucyl aminopeptidase
MPSAANLSMLRCIFTPLPAVEVDVLVVPLFEGRALDGAAAAADAATGGELARALQSREFSGKSCEIFITPVTDRSWKPRRLALVGLGPADGPAPFAVRRAAAAAGLAARSWRPERLGFLVAGADAAVAQAAAEGLTLSEFYNGSYKTADPAPAAPQFAVVNPDGAQAPAVEAAVRKGRVLGECSNAARALANEPGNTLTPREFAVRASALASEAGVAVEVLDERRIDDLGMGLLMGVARGSSEPPRLIVFRHEPSRAAGPVLGIIGKGVTFDTGGISIKPAEGMERMKDDMAGGAAVAAAMRAIALLGAPIRVIGVVPATENMPGGRAVKPGDVLKSAEGKTVEVINTDAEGRLILGDALWYARRLGATHLVDVATLTGAIVVALGRAASGLFGTSDRWVKEVARAADRAGDRVWELPLYDEYRDQIKSEIADFTNTGGRPAGASTAAMFLKEFTGGLPWAHLDIAGTAWAEEPKPWQPKGATGVAVRTLAELALGAESWASW